MQINRRFNILIILFCLCISTAMAQVKLEVASQVNEGRKFTLTLVVNTLQCSAPKKIDIPNCRLIYGGAESTSISAVVINGQMQQSETKRISYTFLAEKASEVTIPAITVHMPGGKSESTKPRKLTILPPDQRASSVDRTSPGMFDDVDNVNINPETHFSANDMFVRIILDKNTVYEQEPVVATIKLYSRLNMGAKFQMLTQPTFEGFLSEELNVTSPQSAETYDGKSYNTYIVKRCVLYPQKAGTLKVTSGTYEITLEDIITVNTGLLLPDHRIMQKTVNTPDKSAVLNVLPLPEPRPATFDGAVGDFTATASLSSTSLRTNDPVTYTVKIAGKGNIKYLKTPKLDIPAGIDQYTPKTDIDATYTAGDITGTYTATYTLVPQEVGDFAIPPLHFTYFNPQTKEYRTIDLKGYEVKVAKGSTVADKKSVEKKMTDILTIHPIKDQLSKERTYVYRTFTYWMLYVIVALAFIASIFIYRRQIRLNADVRGRRLARAMRKAMKRFKTAQSMMHAHNSEKFYAEVTRALIGYLSDKLDIPASQLVRDNIANQLSAYGADQQAIDNIIAILDDCEMARFTPMHSDTDMSTLYNRTVQAVKSIENVKKQG